MERFIENAMYASRWLLAPIYFGLSLGLLALALKFFQEVFHVIPNVFSMAESDLILPQMPSVMLERIVSMRLPLRLFR